MKVINEEQIVLKLPALSRERKRASDSVSHGKYLHTALRNGNWVHLFEIPLSRVNEPSVFAKILGHGIDSVSASKDWFPKRFGLFKLLFQGKTDDEPKTVHPCTGGEEYRMAQIKKRDKRIILDFGYPCEMTIDDRFIQRLSGEKRKYIVIDMSGRNHGAVFPESFSVMIDVKNVLDFIMKRIDENARCPP